MLLSAQGFEPSASHVVSSGTTPDRLRDSLPGLYPTPRISLAPSSSPIPDELSPVHALFSSSAAAPSAIAPRDPTTQASVATNLNTSQLKPRNLSFSPAPAAFSDENDRNVRNSLSQADTASSLLSKFTSTTTAQDLLTTVKATGSGMSDLTSPSSVSSRAALDAPVSGPTGPTGSFSSSALLPDPDDVLHSELAGGMSGLSLLEEIGASAHELESTALP